MEPLPSPEEITGQTRHGRSRQTRRAWRISLPQILNGLLALLLSLLFGIIDYLFGLIGDLIRRCQCRHKNERDKICRTFLAFPEITVQGDYQFYNGFYHRQMMC